jgi:hypothetical protein
MIRRLKLLVISAVALPVLAYVAWVGYVRLIREPLQINTLVGRSEGRIRGSYGQPDQDWLGYHSLGLDSRSEDRRAAPTLPTRTLIVRPRGLLHPEGGTLWVWLVERDGQWICSGSCWFAEGVVF